MIVVVGVLFLISLSMSLMAIGKWFAMDRHMEEMENDLIVTMKSVELLKEEVDKCLKQ